MQTKCHHRSNVGHVFVHTKHETFALCLAFFALRKRSPLGDHFFHHPLCCTRRKTQSGDHFTTTCDNLFVTSSPPTVLRSVSQRTSGSPPDSFSPTGHHVFQRMGVLWAVDTTLFPSPRTALTDASGSLTSASKNFMQHFLPPPRWHFRWRASFTDCFELLLSTPSLRGGHTFLDVPTSSVISRTS